MFTEKEHSFNSKHYLASVVEEAQQTYQASVEVVDRPFRASAEVVVRQVRQTCQASAEVVDRPFRASGEVEARPFQASGEVVEEVRPFLN